MAERRIDGPIRVEYWPLTDILAHPRNPHDHDVGLIQQSMSRWGYTEPVVIDEKSGRLAAGHGRCKTLSGMKLGGEKPPERVLAKDGEWWVPVVRGIAFKDDAEHQAYLVASNRIVEAGGWIDELLKDVLVTVGANTEASLTGTGFDVHDVERMVGNLDMQRGPADAPPPAKDPWVKAGDLFALGNHRLLCGNSSERENFHRLTRGEVLDVILTDPPYCSGGFQESDRPMGSIGTNRKDKQTGRTPEVANDNLSTRGYRALIGSVLDVWPAKIAYVFTDWRMWINLTDVMESQRYAVRSMLVWDKGTPGMGRTWLSQHELIALGARVKAPFPQTPARGNVIRCDRSGNAHHPTEKPLDLLKEIISNTSHEVGRTFADPFIGSGSTIIACEALNRACYGMELSPVLCQVAIERWEQFSGRQSERLDEVGMPSTARAKATAKSKQGKGRK